MKSGEVYSVKWNNYTPVLRTVFRRYLKEEAFTDVTLACETEAIKCHRLILCACSPYFDKLLQSDKFPPNSNTIIFLKDLKPWQLRSLVSYMYNGEVNVQKENLQELVAAAQTLNIKGLAPDLPEDKIDPDVVVPKPSTSTPASGSRGTNGSLPDLKRKIQLAPPRLGKLPRFSNNDGSDGSNQMQNGGGSGEGKRMPMMSLANNPFTIGGKKPIPALQEIEVKDEAEGPEEQNMFDMEEVTVGETEDGYETDTIKQENENSSTQESDGEEEDGDDLTEDLPTQNEITIPSVIVNHATHATNVVKRRSVYKYSQEVRSTVLAALHSGLTIRQCSDTYNIPRKTLSKWRQRDAEESNANSTTNTMANQSFSNLTTEELSVERVEDEPNVSPDVPKSRRAAGVSIDSGDRAERLESAMKLALSGTTVRQAAVQFEIPRTTLCAYMKRRGVQAKKIAPGGKCTYTVLKNEPGTSSEPRSIVNSAEYPFLGLNSIFMDDMDGQNDFDDEEDDYDTHQNL